MLVATGLLAHFSIVLLRFLRRRERNAMDDGRDVDTKTCPPVGSGGFATRWKLYIMPACLVLLLGAWTAMKARPPVEPADQFALYEFGKLPVVFQGRVEPIDTLARNSLRIISDRQTFVDGDERQQPAIRWFLDVVARPEIAAAHRVFRIEHPEVLSVLTLGARKGLRYSYAELEPHKDEIAKEARLARAHDSAQLSVYQKKMVELDGKLGLQEMLARSFARPKLRSDPQFREVDLHIASQEQELLEQQMPPLAIPPHEHADAWMTFARAGLREASQLATGERTTGHAALSSWQAIFDAYARGETEQFNTGVAGYLASLETGSYASIDLGRTNLEAAFNHFEPFYHACVLYVISFLLTAVSWLVWSRPLTRAAFWAVAFTFAIHTIAVLLRIYISGRPPVTNL
jgi:hypothetical protein